MTYYGLQVETTFDQEIQLTGLYAFSEYRIEIRALNLFTEIGRRQPERVSCFTMMGSKSVC